MENLQAGEGCQGPLILIVCAVLVLATVGAAALGVTERITAHQATQAQAQAVQEQARSAAQIEAERQQTEQVRERESHRTERWEAFLVAMNGVKADVTAQWPFVLAMVTLWVLAGAFVLRDRRGEK